MGRIVLYRTFCVRFRRETFRRVSGGRSRGLNRRRKYARAITSEGVRAAHCERGPQARRYLNVTAGGEIITMKCCKIFWDQFPVTKFLCSSREFRIDGILQSCYKCALILAYNQLIRGSV